MCLQLWMEIPLSNPLIMISLFSKNRVLKLADFGPSKILEGSRQQAVSSVRVSDKSQLFIRNTHVWISLLDPRISFSGEHVVIAYSRAEQSVMSALLIIL